MDNSTTDKERTEPLLDEEDRKTMDGTNDVTSTDKYSRAVRDVKDQFGGSRMKATSVK